MFVQKRNTDYDVWNWPLITGRIPQPYPVSKLKLLADPSNTQVNHVALRETRLKKLADQLKTHAITSVSHRDLALLMYLALERDPINNKSRLAYQVTRVAIGQNILPANDIAKQKAYFQNLMTSSQPLDDASGINAGQLATHLMKPMQEEFTFDMLVSRTHMHGAPDWNRLLTLLNSPDAPLSLYASEVSAMQDLAVQFPVASQWFTWLDRVDGEWQDVEGEV